MKEKKNVTQCCGMSQCKRLTYFKNISFISYGYNRA